MPNLDKLASTLKGRKNLLIIFAMVRNEAAFFLCVQEYKKKPTKTRAMTIHNWFLKSDSPCYCAALIGKVGTSAYKNWYSQNLFRGKPDIVINYFV